MEPEYFVCVEKSKFVIRHSRNLLSLLLHSDLRSFTRLPKKQTQVKYYTLTLQKTKLGEMELSLTNTEKYKTTGKNILQNQSNFFSKRAWSQKHSQAITVSPEEKV